MRYLTLAADYGQLSIQDERVGPVDTVALGIPGELMDELAGWNARYQEIIPLSVAERHLAKAAALIGELDALGLELAERLASAVEGEVKVKYYSEGLLRHLV